MSDDFIESAPDGTNITVRVESAEVTPSMEPLG